MSQFDDLSSSEAYQENVAHPDERAWAREAEARQISAVVVEPYKSGCRCVHEEERYRFPRAIVVELSGGFQVLADLCYVCLHNLEQARNG